MRVYGCVNGGKLRVENKEVFEVGLRSFKDDEPLLITIKRADWVLRSERQNRYYHGVVLKIIEDETGQDRESIHAYFRQLFLSEEGSHGIRKLSRTSELSTREFEEYVRKVRERASEWGMYIPLPNESEIEYEEIKKKSYGKGKEASL